MKAKVTGVTAWQGTPTGGTLSIRAPRYVDSSGNASPEEYSAVLDVSHTPPRWMDALDPTRELYVIVQGPDDLPGVRARFYEVLHYGPTKSVRTEFTRKLISSDLSGLIFDYAMPEPTDIPVGFGDAPLTMRAAQQVIEEGGAVVSEWSDIKVDIAQTEQQLLAANGRIPWAGGDHTTLPAGAGDYLITRGAEAGQVWTRMANGAMPERNIGLESGLNRDRLAIEAMGAGSAANDLDGAGGLQTRIVTSVRDWHWQPAASDDTAQLQAAINNIAGISTGTIKRSSDGTEVGLGGTIYIPAGVHKISSALTWPAGCNWVMDQGAILKAIAPITGPMIVSPLSTLMQDRFFMGGTVDANNLAETTISARYFSHLNITDTRLHNATVNALILGEAGAPASSYEAVINNVHVWRSRDYAKATGYGIWYRNTTDNKTSSVQIVGSDTGVRIDTPNSEFTNVHVWGFSGKNPTIAFDDNGGANDWIGCYADTPTQYGFRLRKDNSTLLGGRVFVGPFGGVDNVVIGVKADTNPSYFTAMGVKFYGVDNTKRLAKDFEFNGTQATIVGSRLINVVSSYSRMTLQGTQPLNIQGNSGQQILNIQGNSAAAVEIVNGYTLRGFSDLYTTLRWELLANTGALRLGRYTTATRPSAATAGNGAQLFDTTLNRPIWSDGANWRDASGTVV